MRHPDGVLDTFPWVLYTFMTAVPFPGPTHFVTEDRDRDGDRDRNRDKG
jgi:hypothetical protein